MNLSQFTYVSDRNVVFDILSMSINNILYTTGTFSISIHAYEALHIQTLESDFLKLIFTHECR